MCWVTASRLIRPVNALCHVLRFTCSPSSIAYSRYVESVIGSDGVGVAVLDTGGTWLLGDKCL